MVHLRLSLFSPRCPKSLPDHNCILFRINISSCLHYYYYIRFTKCSQALFLLLLFSRSVMSYALQPHGLQHARLPCPLPSPGASSNSWPLSQWCHPIILSSVVPFSSYIQSSPASGSFLMSQLFTSGGQSIGASASASVLLMNIQDWFPLGLTGSNSLQFTGLSRVFSNTTVEKQQFFDT